MIGLLLCVGCLTGTITVDVVFVAGPGEQWTAAEMAAATATVEDGLGWWADIAPAAANLRFVVASRVIAAPVIPSQSPTGGELASDQQWVASQDNPTIYIPRGSRDQFKSYAYLCGPYAVIFQGALFPANVAHETGHLGCALHVASTSIMGAHHQLAYQQKAIDPATVEQIGWASFLSHRQYLPAVGR